MKRDQKIWLRLRGATDARLGRAITSFNNTLAAQQNVAGAQKEYEIGYREAKKEIEMERGGAR